MATIIFSALVPFFASAPYAQAAGAGNIQVTGAGCGIPDQFYPSTIGTFGISGGTLYYITATDLSITQGADKTITGVTYGNYVFNFNTTNHVAGLTAPSGSSLNAAPATTYTGPVGPDGYFSYHVAATLGCGQTITGEFSLTGG